MAPASLHIYEVGTTNCCWYWLALFI